MVLNEMRNTSTMCRSSFVGNEQYTVKLINPVYCANPICRQLIGREDPYVNTETGKMHEKCAWSIVEKILLKAKLPPPSQWSIPKIEEYLYEQINALDQTSDQIGHEPVEHSLCSIYRTADFLQIPVRWHAITPWKFPITTMKTK